jgi:hypothetical protein
MSRRTSVIGFREASRSAKQSGVSGVSRTGVSLTNSALVLELRSSWLKTGGSYWNGFTDNHDEPDAMPGQKLGDLPLVHSNWLMIFEPGTKLPPGHERGMPLLP